jgi:MFS transporter, CP family, cyanate transporter
VIDGKVSHSDSPGSRSLWAGRTLALLGIVLVALSLRSAVTAMSPIFDQISADVPLNDLALGVIGMLPPLMLATGGLIGPSFARSVGLEASLVLACLAMLAGHIARSLANDFSQLLVGSVLAMLGMGLGNVLLPPVVKRYFPDRIALLTTIYAMLFSASTAIPGAVSALITDATGWRTALALWGVVALLAAPPWVVLLVRARRKLPESHEDSIPASRSASHGGIGLWRSRLAWGLLLMHGLASLNGYAMLAWLPELLTGHAGTSSIEAGVLLSIYAITAFPLSLIAPAIAVRLRNGGMLAHVGAAAFVAGYLGLLLVPNVLTPLWVVTAALGTGLFPVMLALINSRTQTPAMTAALSGFVQGQGSLVAVAGPLVVGILRDLTGGWTVPICFLIVTSIGIVLAGMMLRNPQTVEEELMELAAKDG